MKVGALGVRGVSIAGSFTVIVVVAAWLWYLTRPAAEHTHPLASSPFLNTGSDAQYIGSSRCATCHPNNHRSYLQTAHSQAMSEVRLDEEPRDAVFDHSASGRRYRIYRKDGQLRHQEALVTSSGDEVLDDHPVKYTIGSGRFSRTYAVELDGFLAESPVTWYAARDKWDMSPGYDLPFHPSFRRTITKDCLTCHSGSVETVSGSAEKVQLRELAIGCERCHGPGSLHAERWADGQHAGGKVDYTIVNPSRLSRKLAESICQQCHLTGDAVVAARGRRISDFRPGLPLEDFQIDFRLGKANQEMTVVGHVEQLQQSACYQASETLNCLTCHDPHHLPDSKRRVEYYRKVCLDCHREEACTVDPQQRQQLSPVNDCTTCHMPQVPTDIPHFAFIHHRIGVHKNQPEPADVADNSVPKSSAAGELSAMKDISHLSDMDRDRALGLGYWDLIVNGNTELTETYGEKSRVLLERARKAGLQDFAVDAVLANLWWRGGKRTQAVELARHVVESSEAEADDRVDALSVLVNAELGAQKFDQAAKRLRELVEMRRDLNDWYVLGMCERQLGRVDKATEALRRCVAIDPGFEPGHRALAQIFSESGETETARSHQSRANKIQWHNLKHVAP